MLGISDLARPCTDYVKRSELVHAHSSNYEGVGGMMEALYLAFAACMLILWLVIGGEGDE